MRGWLSLVENHIEKAILALGVLFTLGVAGYYLMGPNKVEYKGEQRGPGELEEAVAQEARSLEQVYARHEHKVEPVPDFPRMLRREFESGVLAADTEGPPLPDELPVAAAFGQPLPELGADEPTEPVALVEPLPPSTPPVMRTGISMVYRQPHPLSGEDVELQEFEEDDAAECSWVTGAVYYPYRAQMREMLAANYAGYLAKVYVVGVDVQRQVMEANGEFSEWESVDLCSAMPQLDVPTPVIDDLTGDILNQQELDEVLDTIRSRQVSILQPAFYPVATGDDWSMPPLPGFEDEEEDVEFAANIERRERTRSEPERRTAPRPGRRTGRGRPGGMPGLPPGMPGAGRSRSTGGAPQQNERARRNELNDELKEAQRALAEDSFAEAKRLAEGVLRDDAASTVQTRKAEQIIARADAALERERATPTGPPGIPMPGRARTATASEPQSVVVRPDSPDMDPAIWFHDDTVQPGKTYRYRMRVKLWNRYVGKPEALKDAADARKVVLTGQWSLPSDPVRVAPKTHFFVRGRDYSSPAATVDVFTWSDGDWYKESFTVQIGDVIGGTASVRTEDLDDEGRRVRRDINFSTGALVMDLRFDEEIQYRRSVGKGEFAYSDAKELVLVYLDPIDGQVRERIARVDRADPVHKRLKERVN